MNAQAVAVIIAGALTVFGTLAAQIYGRHATSKQLDRTLGEQRTRMLNERFATAADQLGNDKPAIRLAGVYAMAGLADDWPENRQTCVDVLCAYLRMPYRPGPGEDAPEPERLAFRASREVRHTVIRVITEHLKDDAAVSWQGLNFAFWGVVFDGGNFREAKFSGGRVDFYSAEFASGTVDFDGAEFSGSTVSFDGAKFSGGRVHLRRAKFSGGTVDFGAVVEFSDGRVDFDGAEFSGGRVDFLAQFWGGMVTFNDAKFSGGIVIFNGELLGGGIVSFSHAEFCRGAISFGIVLDDSGVWSFRRAKFSGSKIDFDGAEFSGSEVNFSHPGDWSVAPEFSWTGTPPAGVKLPHL